MALAARSLERALSELTLAQLRVLGIVSSNPGRASRLAERAALSRPTLSGLLDGLVGRGWVVRDAVAGDRRGVHLAITESGRRVLRHGELEAAAALGVLLAELAPATALAAADALASLGGAVEARVERRAAAGEVAAMGEVR